MTAHPAGRRLWDALCTGDGRTGRHLMVEQLDRGIAGSALIQDLLAPAQRDVGERWQRGELSVADEHLGTAVVDASLAVIESSSPAPKEGAALLAVTCAESEWHTLPARMAAQILREGGAHVRFLGPSMPADHLREYLARLQPDALVLSATMPTSLPGAARSIEAAHDVGVPVITGGPAFGADAALSVTLGADSWLSDPQAFGPTWRPDRISAPPLQLAWSEFLTLEHAAPALTMAAFDGLLRRVPSLHLMSSSLTARTREDLGRMIDVLAVSVLVREGRVLQDFTVWLRDVLQSRGVPEAALEASYRALADELDPPTAAWFAGLTGEASVA